MGVGGVCGVTAAMVTEERKKCGAGGSFSSCRVWLTDVGHQSFFFFFSFPPPLRMHALASLSLCIRKGNQSRGFVAPKGEASGFSAQEDFNTSAPT